MAVNDLYRCSIYQNVGSEITMNVCHLRETVSTTPPERGQDACVEIIAELYRLWAELLSEDWRVTVISCRRVSPPSGIPATTVFGGGEAIVGQVESEIVPSAAAILCSLYTDSVGRTGRGRQFIPGCAESIQNEGQLLEIPYSGATPAIETYYESEQTWVGGSTGKYRFNIWAPPAAVSGTHDVKIAFVQANLATQKRRRAFPGFGAA